MGDRFVVGFKASQTAPTIYLYSHWGGDERHKTAAEAVEAARTRWQDPDYATRIAISYIVGNAWSDLGNYGISANSFCSPDYDDIAIINWETRKVELYRGEQHDYLTFEASIEFEALTRFISAA